MLYIMAKPPASAIPHILDVYRQSAKRPTCNLHITLMPLFDPTSVSAEWLSTLARSLDNFQAAPFRVIFDQLVRARDTVLLAGSEKIIGAAAFQRRLRQFLIWHQLPIIADKPCSAHVTLRYFSDGMGAEAIDPISWRVDDILLVLSQNKRHRHIGRWPLSAARN